MKLVDQCRTKQVLDYIREHCPKVDQSQSAQTNKKGKKGQKKLEEQVRLFCLSSPLFWNVKYVLVFKYICASEDTYTGARISKPIVRVRKM